MLRKLQSSAAFTSVRVSFSNKDAVDVRPTWLIKDDLSRSLIASAKTLFPNKVPLRPQGLGQGHTFWRGHDSTRCRLEGGKVLVPDHRTSSWHSQNSHPPLSDLKATLSATSCDACSSHKAVTPEEALSKHLTSFIHITAHLRISSCRHENRADTTYLKPFLST